jgi:hypothetical protein
MCVKPRRVHTAQLMTLFALSNWCMARHRLLRMAQ